MERSEVCARCERAIPKGKGFYMPTRGMALCENCYDDAILWGACISRPAGRGNDPIGIRRAPTKPTPAAEGLRGAQDAVAWMSRRADDICGDTQRQEWAKQIVILDRFLHQAALAGGEGGE